MSSYIDLLCAFKERNFEKFKECFEIYLENPIEPKLSLDKTIFEEVLSSPKSADYIKLFLVKHSIFFMVK
jgi:hypothetical protein